jgi:UDP-N-acetylmuramoyl-L-alanyl-D-glutamate--2,6-diaminopimelate ligase
MLAMPGPTTIASLLADLPASRLVRGEREAVIRGVEHDSRQVAAGGLFVAVHGFSVDGHTYLPQAASAGAAAVLVQEDHAGAATDLPEAVSVVAVPDTRKALSRAAAWFHGYPSRVMRVSGITGTDGKTTTCHMLTSILEAAGARVARMGTVDVYIPGRTEHASARMSTPEANQVHRILKAALDAGCDHVVVESTSHGLALNRLDDVEYDVAAVTNVTGDHLDFHHSFEAYREAKSLLFASLEHTLDKGIPKTAIVNADDPSAAFMLGQAPNARHLGFGFEAREAEVVARNVHLRADGTSFRLVTPIGTADVNIQLPALFNVANALCAASVGLSYGIPLPEVARGLELLRGVPGRMEAIDAGQPYTVIVDYAHTGDAVRKALGVLREVSSGKLIIVVGAAGDRDPGRRFGVARAAAEGADFAVFTNEDPRNEDPDAIVREIGSHAEGAGRVRGSDFIEVEDRRDAIRAAFARAEPEDVVLICGKGHEQSMIYGAEARPWDDRTVAREELAAAGFASA